VTTRNPKLRLPAAVAVAIGAFLVVIDLLLQPLYERGVGQGVLSHLNGLSALVSLPGFLVAHVTGLRRGHHTTLGVWWFILVANVGLYAAGVAVAAGAARWAAGRLKRRRLNVGRGAGNREATAGGRSDATRSDATAPASPAAGPRHVSRRRVLAAGAGSVAAVAVGYPMCVATRRFEVTRRAFPVRDLPPSLEGLRLVQLTDVHHGPWIPLSHVRDVVAAANALEPDLILLTGDYVHRSPAYIDPVVDALAALHAKVGVLGVLGNHDWWESGPATRRAFARAGIPLIDNARRVVTPDRKLTADEGGDGGAAADTVAGAGLCVAGVGDYYEDEQRYDAALGGLPPDMPRLLLSHNPDVAEDRAFRAAGHRVDLMLSGHTHGGQIYVPGLGTPIVPSRYGQKYARGLVQGPACPVFVCRGVGHTVLPVRVGVAPEIAVIELSRA
jgi:predicted MPP superfamily phosphohydrolase